MNPFAKSTVCLDGRSFGLAHGNGVATYARTLASGLQGSARPMGLLVDHTTDTHLTGRTRRWLRAIWPSSAKAIRSAETAGSKNEIWLAPDVYRLSQVHFDIHSDLLTVRSASPPGVMHWTYPVPLIFKGVPNIYTIHDLIPWLHPELSGIDRSRYMRIVARIAAVADHIVTVSETSRRDIINHLGLAETSVTNTYQPVQIPFEATHRTLRYTGHFFFCGKIEPRKNIARVIAAHHASTARVPLILAGADGWSAATELAFGGQPVRRLVDMPVDAQGGVWRAGLLERDDLIDLLRGARALIFPSLAEGFGLPIVEAMSLGVPVLTSRGGATAEIAGGAALLVNPLDTAGMARAILALATDDALCARLASDGLRRAQAFSMQSYLARLDSVYVMGLKGGQ